MNEYFVDKLSIHQEHLTQLPIVGSSLCIEEDLLTGEVISKSPKALQLEGSYSSKIIIRCNGSRVSVSGNPSRYNRIDNLFGFKTIEECVQVFNILLEKHGLPPFTKCSNVWFGQSEDGAKARKITDGAIITAVDWTKNHTVGEDNVKQFLRGLSSQSIGRGKVGHLYSNQCTVNWGEGSEYKLTSMYDKENDLKRQRKKRLKHASDEDIKYYDDLILYCKNYGVAREEHKFKRLFLDRNNLKFYGLFKDSDFEPYLKSIDDVMSRCEVTGMKQQSIADQLLSKEIVKTRQAANATQCYASMWMDGDDLHNHLGRSQWFEHKSRLKKIGLDITSPFDVTRMAPVLIKRKVIEVSVLSAPSWYRNPQVLRLVS
ncbi:MAG: II/X family phage/plasmid replication protein [Colwellia sp.]|jgi:II/X family phage/plasmid replication protein